MLGHLMHRPEEGPTLVQKLNALRAEKNPPPEPRPTPNDIFWDNLTSDWTRQDEEDRIEMLARVKALRMSTADPGSQQRLDTAERQLTEGYSND